MTQLIRKTWLLVLPGLWAVAGCQPRGGRSATKQRELMHTSFEEMAGWAPEIAPTLTTVKVHTGKYAMRVDPQNAYSFTYRSSLGALCPGHRPRRLTLSAWVWVPRFQDNAVIVASISNPADPDHPILSKYLYLNDSGPFGQWKYVSRDLDLPAGIHSNTQLVIYLWKVNANAPVYADDLRLTELW